MNKAKTIKICAIILALAAAGLAVGSVLCGVFSRPDYPTLIDGARKYERREITAAQKNVAENCTVGDYFSSGEYKVIRVICTRGYVDEVELLVLLRGNTIEKIEGINVRETPDYGGKCFNERYLSQFVGIDLSQTKVLRGKETDYDEGEIIYVAHATTTSRAIISAINAVALFLQSL